MLILIPISRPFHRDSSIYMGVYHGMVYALAPALAFLAGKPLLSIWVDLEQVHISIRLSYILFLGLKYSIEYYCFIAIIDNSYARFDEI